MSDNRVPRDVNTGTSSKIMMSEWIGEIGQPKLLKNPADQKLNIKLNNQMISKSPPVVFGSVIFVYLLTMSPRNQIPRHQSSLPITRHSLFSNAFPVAPT